MRTRERGRRREEEGIGVGGGARWAQVLVEDYRVSSFPEKTLGFLCFVGMCARASCTGLAHSNPSGLISMSSRFSDEQLLG